jgi:hypothetical protein
MTDRELKIVENLALIGLNMEQIALMMDVSYQSLHRYMRADERIGVAIKRGRARGLAKAAETAFNMATSGKSADMTKFFLRAKGNWNDRPDVQNNTQVNVMNNAAPTGEAVTNDDPAGDKLRERLSYDEIKILIERERRLKAEAAIDVEVEDATDP